eukprot:CAMPEP_0196207904 /NCGR_PEP_ID=MMETSP0912-20130531/8711_1 /TAXON_ID=49265 /ORGANISM="Thalassiosira rotula, Strain GSO102" /LENGTH=414 /DNA_ID=CAMNT_0041482631 /DNA_START=53 /DNA_END=1297 /DNA_ORIENTATION=+
MENNCFPKLKTIAAFIVGSCAIVSLFHQHYLLPSTSVDQPPNVLEEASSSNNTPAVFPWLRSSVVVDQLPTRVEKPPPNDDTGPTYPWLRSSAAVNQLPTQFEKPPPNEDTGPTYPWLRTSSAVVNRSPTWERVSPDDETSAVYPWARRNVRAHARAPDPSKETLLFWHIPKSGGSTAKSIYKCIGKKVSIASQPGEIMKLKHKGLVPSGQADLIFSSFPDLAIEHLYDEQHKARVLAMFRHPVDRLVSKFYYLQVATWENTYRPEWKDMDILEWVQNHNADNNHMVKKLAGKGQTEPADETDLKRAKRTVWQRMIVGVTEEMEESIHRFNIVAGISDTSVRGRVCMKQFFARSGKEKRRNSVSYSKIEKGHSAWDYLAERNQFDIELYELVLKLFKKQKGLIDSYRTLETWSS